MSFREDRQDEVIDQIRDLVCLDDGETWDDPYSLLESIGDLVDSLNFRHDPSKPLGPKHDCMIWAKSCETWRDCYCNVTGGRDHNEHEATLIGSNGKAY